MNDIPIGVLAAAMLTAILTVGFFSATETAMMALNRYRLKHLASKGDKRAERAMKLLERPDKLIIMVLIGNNLLGAVAAVIGGNIGMRLSGDPGVAIMTAVVAFLMMIFADNAPKSLAAYYPEKVALPSVRVLEGMLVLLFPVVWALSHINAFLLKLFRIDVSQANQDGMSVDELRTIVLETHAHAPRRRHSMLLNVLDLEKVSVEDIMVPRHEVFALNLDDSDEELQRKLLGCEFTRVLVCQGDIDNVVGVLHMRSAGRFMSQEGIDRKQMMTELQDPYFIPEGTPLHTQLFNFQKAKRRMGVVVDEYGVLQGLATLEDILEEIVGEFTSNLLDASEDIRPEEDGSYLIEGTASIRDINRSLSWSLPTDGPRTLNGLIVEQLESFPEPGATLKLDNYYFEVLDVDERCIRKARASRV